MIVEYKLRLFQEKPGDHSKSIRDNLRGLGTDINVNEVRKLNYKDTAQRHQDFVNKMFDLTKENNTGYASEEIARAIGEAFVPIIHAAYYDMTYPIMWVSMEVEQNSEDLLFRPKYNIKFDTSG